jgi:hypothetical protein
MADLRAKTAPMPPPSTAFPLPQPTVEASGEYVIERDTEDNREPITNQLLRITRNLLLLLLAVISLALFCLVALLLGVF